MKRQIRKKRIVGSLLFCVLCFAIAYLANHHLTVTKYAYQNEKLPEELNGYRILQLSDLHNASFGIKNKRLLEMVDECKPDCVVLTGDIVDSNYTNLDLSINTAKALAQKYDTYYVTGNHEYWLSKDEFDALMTGLNEANVKVLNNELVTAASVEDGGISILGLDDESLGFMTLNSILTKQEEEMRGQSDVVVVLAHEPQYFDQYVSTKADLVLTGHAHGGQVRLPLLGGLVAPDQGLFPTYTEGAFESNHTTMIVSRGLGNSIIPVRVFNDPELVLIELFSQ